MNQTGQFKISDNLNTTQLLLISMFVRCVYFTQSFITSCWVQMLSWKVLLCEGQRVSLRFDQPATICVWFIEEKNWPEGTTDKKINGINNNT